MRTDLPALLLAASLAAAGCASRSVPPPLPGSGSHWEPDNSPGPPWAEEEGQETEPPDLGDAQGIAGIVFHAPVAKGDVLVEGTAEDSNGSERAPPSSSS